jgi:uncharacterized UBP type Zn finger protein
MDPDFKDRAELLASAGFSTAQAMAALAATGGNVEAAMNWCLRAPQNRIWAFSSRIDQAP